MPNMADITVKNAAGTDVIYNSAMPSAGDKSPARWTQNLANTVQGFRPSLDVTTRVNGDASVRRMEFSFRFPSTYVDSATGLSKLNAPVLANGVIFLPATLGTDVWNEAYIQLGNLLASTLIRQVAATGYAPT